MSQSLWRCRNHECLVPRGAILGRVTADGGLVLSPEVTAFKVFLDTQRAMIGCPACDAIREFRGNALFSPQVSRCIITTWFSRRKRGLDYSRSGSTRGWG